MLRGKPVCALYSICLAAGTLLFTVQAAFSELNLGPEQLVTAGGSAVVVPGYSVPSFVDWNNDGFKDLIVGEGSGSCTPKVRVYINSGAYGNPQFTGYFYAQSNGSDLTTPGSGCLGLFPRVVYWDADNYKDLLVGQSDGKIRLFLNDGAGDENPTFDGGTLLQVGDPGSKTDIDVGSRATSTVVDWNSDGRKDLVVGAYDGKIHIFLNEGTDASPDFRSESFAQENGSNLFVPINRSSPVVLDLDDDGKKDLLAGNTEGQLLFYSNVGSDGSPVFSGHSLIDADGSVIDLMGVIDARSRPFVCDWTGDGLPDVLIGAGDGQVHLYQGVPEPASLSLLAVGGLVLIRRRR